MSQENVFGANKAQWVDDLFNPLQEEGPQNTHNVYI